MRNLNELKINHYDEFNNAGDLKYNIALLEQRLGGKLPDDLKCFMLDCNGGSPALNTYVPKNREKNDERDVSYFFNIGDDFDDVENIFNVDNEHHIENRCCPVAEDSFGNCIVLSLRDKTYGKIYFADHEDEFRLSLIADSFGEFIDMLYEFDVSKLEDD